MCKKTTSVLCTTDVSVYARVLDLRLCQDKTNPRQRWNYGIYVSQWDWRKESKK